MIRRDRAKSVLANVRRIIHAIHSQSSLIEATLGISGPQLWALREISTSVEGLALGEVAKRLALHRANAGRLVERLVAKKLVRSERPANDRRFIVARVTKRGEKLGRKPIPGPAQADLLARLATLKEREITAMDASLARLVKLLGAEGVEPAPLFDERPRKGRRTKS